METAITEASTYAGDYLASIRAAVRGLWKKYFTPSEFTALMKDNIDKYLFMAWKEAAKRYDIDPLDFTVEDEREIARTIVQQYDFIAGFADDIKNSSTLAPMLLRSGMWANRYNEIFSYALTWFGQDEKLEWLVNPAKESCDTCLALNHWVKRASYWQQFYAETGLRPQAPALDCHGYRCGCELRPTKKTLSKGRPPAVVSELAEGWVTLENGQHIFISYSSAGVSIKPRALKTTRRHGRAIPREPMHYEGGLTPKQFNSPFIRDVQSDDEKNFARNYGFGSRGYDDTVTLKKQVCENVAKDLTGDQIDREDEARKIVHQWAETSNDNSKDSMRLQNAISEEFNVPLSNWQKNKIKKMGGLKGIEEQEYLKTDTPTMRKAVRGMYNRTQEHLAKEGVSEVTVYRGLTVKGGHVHKWVQHGATREFNGNAVESWSLDPSTALTFARGDYAENKGKSWWKYNIKPVVIKTKVPRSRILSTFRTGFGCSSENEVLVLSSRGTSDTGIVLDVKGKYGEKY